MPITVHAKGNVLILGNETWGQIQCADGGMVLHGTPSAHSSAFIRLICGSRKGSIHR